MEVKYISCFKKVEGALEWQGYVPLLDSSSAEKTTAPWAGNRHPCGVFCTMASRCKLISLRLSVIIPILIVPLLHGQLSHRENKTQHYVKIWWPDKMSSNRTASVPMMVRAFVLTFLCYLTFNAATSREDHLGSLDSMDSCWSHTFAFSKLQGLPPSVR